MPGLLCKCEWDVDLVDVPPSFSLLATIALSVDFLLSCLPHDSMTWQWRVHRKHVVRRGCVADWALMSFATFIVAVWHLVMVRSNLTRRQITTHGL